MGLSKKNYYLLISLFPLSLIILGIFLEPPSTIVKGIYQIILHPDLLLTDYIYVGGLSAALVNSSIVMLLNLLILYKLDLKLNGSLVAALFTVLGFSFFGKNIINIWPIYLGGLLYCKYEKIHFKSIVLIMLFGTSLAPVITLFSSSFGIPIIGGLIIGMIIGFILPPLAIHMVKFHDGYNLYNIGFTCGIIASIITALLRSFGFQVDSQQLLSVEYDTQLKLILGCFFIAMIIFGFLLNNRSFKGYKKIFKYSGRLVTDFTTSLGIGITLINMGIMGLIGIIYVIILNGTMNGPIVGGILTMAGFGAFGKHPKNTIPIMTGVYLAGLVKVWGVNTSTIIISGLFGTTLAPIAGSFGIPMGLLAGFLHLSVVMNVGYLHGGLNLYNNGLAGGFVAAFLVPIINSFSKEEDDEA